MKALGAKDRFLQETLEFWQKRTRRKLTLDDAREIAENMTTFFDVLFKSDASEHSPAISEVSR